MLRGTFRQWTDNGDVRPRGVRSLRPDRLRRRCRVERIFAVGFTHRFSLYRRSGKLSLRRLRRGRYYRHRKKSLVSSAPFGRGITALELVSLSQRKLRDQ